LLLVTPWRCSEITAAGAKVRALKDSGADKAEIETAVAALLACKQNYTTVTGEEVPGTAACIHACISVFVRWVGGWLAG